MITRCFTYDGHRKRQSNLKKSFSTDYSVYRGPCVTSRYAERIFQTSGSHIIYIPNYRYWLKFSKYVKVLAVAAIFAEIFMFYARLSWTPFSHKRHYNFCDLDGEIFLFENIGKTTRKVLNWFILLLIFYEINYKNITFGVFYTIIYLFICSL
jgi:hypothetical protein